jgi:hypothetical protein
MACTIAWRSGRALSHAARLSGQLRGRKPSDSAGALILSATAVLRFRRQSRIAVPRASRIVHAASRYDNRASTHQDAKCLGCSGRRRVEIEASFELAKTLRRVMEAT